MRIDAKWIAALVTALCAGPVGGAFVWLVQQNEQSFERGFQLCRELALENRKAGLAHPIPLWRDEYVEEGRP